MFFAIKHPVHAQRVIRLPCGQTELIEITLFNKFGEESIGSGFSGKENQVKLFTSHSARKIQTWTILIIYPDGTSCILDSGSDWFVEPLILRGDPS